MVEYFTRGSIFADKTHLSEAMYWEQFIHLLPLSSFIDALYEDTFSSVRLFVFPNG